MDSTPVVDMSQEIFRTGSFDKNPFKPVTSFGNIYPSSDLRYLLSKAGFYRDDCSIEDEVRCFSCGLVLKDWGSYYTEYPLSIHLCKSPNCEFLKCQNYDETSIVRGSDSSPSSCCYSPTAAEVATVRRQLFTGDDSNRSNSRILTDDQIQSRITLPFKPKVGDNSMLFESKRYSSFNGFSDAKAKDLASSGFVLKSVNKIVCVFCGKQTDFPSPDSCLSAGEIHKTLNPNCPYIRGFQLGNVTCALESAIERDNQGNDDDNMHIEQSEDDTLIDDTANSINLPIAPIIYFPQFEDFEIRKNTFENWSPQMRPISLHLTEAGFFYSGTGDKVICYSCGHGLSDWEPEADAKVEHAKHSLDCFHLRKLPDYQDIIQQASQTQTMTTCEIENSDPTVLPESPVKLPSPFKPSMDASIIPGIQAALAKRCPSFALLVGWMVAARKEFTMMQEMRGNIHVKEQQIVHKDQQIVHKDQQIEQDRRQIERDRRQRELHRQQIDEHKLEILAREREHIHTTYRVSEKEKEIDELSAENRQLKLEVKLLKENKTSKDFILNAQNECILQLEDSNRSSNNTIMQLRRELEMSTSRRG